MLFRGLFLSAKQPLSTAVTSDVSGLVDLTHFSPLLDTYVEANIPHVIYSMSDDIYDRLLSNESIPTSTTGCDADYFIFNQYANTDDVAVFIVDFNSGLKSQMLHPLYQTSVYDAISAVQQNTVEFKDSPPLTVQLTGGMYEDSLTKQIVSTYPTIFTGNDGTVKTDLARTITLVVCRISSGNNNDLSPWTDVTLLEAFTGSLSGTIDRVTGKTTSILDNINTNSQYIKIVKNVPIAAKYSESDLNVTLWSSTRDVMQLSYFNPTSMTMSKADVYTYLSNMLEKFKNLDDYDVDLVVDAGLSTVLQYMTPAGQLNFSTLKADINSVSDLSDWKHVCDMFTSFCEERGDCVALLDAPRTLTLDGNVKKIRKTSPANTFSMQIGKRLKNVSVFNSSYVAEYLPWWKPINSPNTFGTWLPPSTAAVQVYVTQPYSNAPAGLNYGVLSNVKDISIKLSRDEAGVVYDKRLNYITLTGGIARLEGQKTMQAAHTAFDRMNVRRLFNFLKKNGRRIMRYYVYEGNTASTRLRVTESLSSMVGEAQKEQAVSEYRVICDSTLNTPTTIDNYELRAIVLVRPVKTIEFIKATFVACRTNANLVQVYTEMVTNGEFNW